MKHDSLFMILPLSVALAIVANLFVYYAFSFVEESPKYEEFCTMDAGPMPTTEEACVAREGVWQPTPEAKIEGQNGPAGYCDLTRECSEDFREAREGYTSKLFVVFLIAGVILLALSRLNGVTRVLAYGLSYGGVLSIIISGVNAWSGAGELFRLFLLAVALGVLVWVGLKKFE
jgi:hypothetical protein